MKISRFTQAVIARNAPHLDDQQLAALLGWTVPELDSWVRSLDYPALADLVLQLQEWEEKMKRHILLGKLPGEPALEGSIGDCLKTWARRLPLGEKLAMPTTRSYRAKSAEDAGSRIILSRSGGQGVKL